MAKGKLMEKIQRLFNIDVREVSLVDRPAINEPFIEVKNKSGLKNNQEEKVMDEKQVKEAIQTALAPLADSVKTVETRLEAQEKALTESAESVKSLIETSKEEGSKTVTEGLKALQEKLDEVVGDTVKRFERVEKIVAKPSSQKIAGQEGDEDGKKSQTKWPSLSGVR